MISKMKIPKIKITSNILAHIPTINFKEEKVITETVIQMRANQKVDL